MALLYTFTVTKTDSTVANFPPSMDSWVGALLSNLNNLNFVGGNTPTTSLIFADATALKAYTDSIKLTAPQQAAVNEWKAAHSISYTHTAYDLPEVTVAGINWIS